MNETYKLKDGVTIPALGFGTWNLTNGVALNSVSLALEAGYKHIDTADMYGNHREVGQAIAQSGIDRSSLFLTTKVQRGSLSKEQVISAGKRFLVELGVDYIDLLLIHWPGMDTPIKETLEGFQELKDRGIIRSIGVSNFTEDLLKEALEESETLITVNQILYSPGSKQPELLSFCEENGIVVTAYSPLGRGTDLSMEVISEIAGRIGKTEAQVIINWVLSKGMIAIPKSTNSEHIIENFEVMDWQLDQEDIDRIDNI